MRKPYNRGMDAEPLGKILVGVVMGSRSDYAVMRAAVEVLRAAPQEAAAAASGCVDAPSRQGVHVSCLSLSGCISGAAHV